MHNKFDNGEASCVDAFVIDFESLAIKCILIFLLAFLFVFTILFIPFTILDYNNTKQSNFREKLNSQVVCFRNRTLIIAALRAYNKDNTPNDTMLKPDVDKLISKKYITMKDIVFINHRTILKELTSKDCSNSIWKRFSVFLFKKKAISKEKQQQEDKQKLDHFIKNASIETLKKELACPDRGKYTVSNKAHIPLKCSKHYAH